MATRLQYPVGPYTGCYVMTTRTACLIMGWLEMVVLVPAMFAGLVLIGIGIIGTGVDCRFDRYGNDGSNDIRISASCASYESMLRGKLAGSGVGILSLGSLYLIGPICLLIGANKGIASYLKPYFALCVVKMVLAFIAVVVFAVLPPHFVLVFPFLLFGIESFKAFIIYCHFKYLVGVSPEWPSGTVGVELPASSHNAVSVESPAKVF